ncbi:MAG: glycerophosphodiester phosphodiesterase [Myxococcota bacterium]
MKQPLVIAHRGSSGESPENSLSAFQRAVSQQADMIETDLHLSRDGVVVIHHDAELKRLGLEGQISDYLASELTALNVAPGAATGEKMPTLAEVLDRFGEDMPFNLELKAAKGNAPYSGLEERTLSEVEERGLLPRMLFSSFDDRVLKRLRSLCPAARIGLLVSPRAPIAVIERAQRLSAEAIHPEVGLVTGALVSKAHGAGLCVYPYTANEPNQMTKLLDCGVDGLITNFPARLSRLLRDWKAG